MRIEPTINHDDCEPHYAPFDKSIPRAAQQIKKFILSELKGFPELSIEHYGSTAIGIGGKNVIDLLLVCPNEKYGNMLGRLDSVGFHKSKYAAPADRPLREAEFAYGKHRFHVHLHLTRKGSTIHREALQFRDFLKKHRKEAKEYENLKRKEVELGHIDRDGYNKPKKDFIKKLLSRISDG